MTEMSKMTLSDAGASKTVQVELQIQTDQNDSLPEAHTLSFFKFGNLPNYREENYMEIGGRRVSIGSAHLVNREYYRDYAEYLTSSNRTVLIRLSLANRSEFALQEVKLELTCLGSCGESVRMLRVDELPAEPQSSDLFMSHRLANMAAQLRRQVSVDERMDHPLCHVHLGTLRPGEIGRAESDIAVLPESAGDYKLKVRILSKEIPVPIIKEKDFMVRGEVKDMGLKDLKVFINQRYLTRKK